MVLCEYFKCFFNIWSIYFGGLQFLKNTELYLAWVFLKYSFNIGSIYFNDLQFSKNIELYLEVYIILLKIRESILSDVFGVRNVSFYFFKNWSKYYWFTILINFRIEILWSWITYFSFKNKLYICNCKNGFVGVFFIYYSFKIKL